MLSLGMLSLTLSPITPKKKRRRGGADAAPAGIDYESIVRERIKQDDEEVMHIINLFIQCQN